MDLRVEKGDFLKPGEPHDVLVLPIVEGEKDLPAEVAAADERMGGRIAELVRTGEFQAKPKDVQVLYPPTAAADAPFRRLALVGLGKLAKLDLETLRRAAGAAAKRARALGLPVALSFVVPSALRDALGGRDELIARAVFDASFLAAYEYEVYKSKKADEPEKEKGDVTAVRLYAPGADARELERAASVAAVLRRAVATARDLGNLPGNDGTPTVLAERARAVAAETGLRVVVLEREAMEALAMGALLGVARGSDEPPKLIVLEHGAAHAANGRGTIAVVGKGITFDSGGISIKPAEKMEEMKFDKCGGSAAIGILEAVARLDLPLHVVGIVPATENLPSGRAQKPGDVRRAMDGQTIEIINTDAEGRLVLADALAYAVKTWDPVAIVDLATLTGACVVALGGVAAGLLSNRDALSDELRRAGDATGERVWPLPLWDDYDEKIKSPVADMKNSGGREGGAITAAKLLERFVQSTPWAHLDIAGTAWTTEERPYHMKGATGFGVRLVVEWLRERARMGAPVT